MVLNEVEDAPQSHMAVTPSGKELQHRNSPVDVQAPLEDHLPLIVWSKNVLNF